MADGEMTIPEVYSPDGLPVSTYREWLEGRWEDDWKKAPGFRALDLYESLVIREAITLEEIAPFIEAALAPHIVAWDIGLRFLGRLASRHEVARQGIRTLIETGRANVRGRSLAAVYDHLPKEFCIELVRRGLDDKSKGVRAVAGDACVSLLLTEMLPELERAACIEDDEKTKSDLEGSIGLLRDAFFLYPPKAEHRQSLIVRISDGYPLRMAFLSPPWCPETIMDLREAKFYAEQFRRLRRMTQRLLRWDAPLQPEIGEVLEIEHAGKYYYVVVLTWIVESAGNIVFAFHSNGQKRDIQKLLDSRNGFNVCVDLLPSKRQGRVTCLDRLVDTSPFWLTRYVKACNAYHPGEKATEWFIYKFAYIQTDHFDRVTALTPEYRAAMDWGCYDFGMVANMIERGYTPDQNERI